MVGIILMQHVTLSKSRLCEPPYLLSVRCNTSLLPRHPVAVLWEQVLCLSVLALLLVLWRSPAPDRLSEAHVAMFTRKHSVRLRICCSVFPALWVTPALVGMPGPRTPWDSPGPSGRRGILPSVGMATVLSRTSGKNLIWFPATVGLRHLTWPGPAEPGRGEAWALWSCFARWGQAHWVAHTGVGASAQAPASRVEEGAGSFINRGFLWLCSPTPYCCHLAGSSFRL